MTLEDHAQGILTPLAIIALVIALVSFFGMVAAGNVPPKVQEVPTLANAVGTLNATLTAPVYDDTNMLAAFIFSGLLIMIFSCYMISRAFYRMIEEAVAVMDIEYDSETVDEEDDEE